MHACSRRVAARKALVWMLRKRCLATRTTCRMTQFDENRTDRQTERQIKDRQTGTMDRRMDGRKPVCMLHHVHVQAEDEMSRVTLSTRDDEAPACNHRYGISNTARVRLYKQTHTRESACTVCHGHTVCLCRNSCDIHTRDANRGSC